MICAASLCRLSRQSQILHMSQVSVKQTDKKVQNLYFQFVLVQLLPYKVELKQGEEIKLSINRGKQMFEETKNIKVSTIDGCISLNRAKLNFIVFTYDPTKIYQFSLKISRVAGLEETPIAEYFFDCNSYIELYLQSSNGAFQDEFKVAEDLEVRLEIYVEKSRYGLERLVREMNNARSKILEQLGNKAFQRITERKVKTNERSVSPRKKRDPSVRNSPIKERPQFSAISPSRAKVATEEVKPEKKQETVKETKYPQGKSSHQIITFVKEPQKVEEEIVSVIKQEENEATVAAKLEVLPITQQSIEIKEEIAAQVHQQRQQAKIQDIPIQQQPKQEQVVMQLTKQEPEIVAQENTAQQNAVPTNEAIPAQSPENMPTKLREFPLKFQIAFAIFLFFILIASNFLQNRSSAKKATLKANATNTTIPTLPKKTIKQPKPASKKKSTR